MSVGATRRRLRNRKRRYSPRARQAGQSLVEMAVALIVLVPLAAGITLLGQYAHIKAQTQAAARQAAWQATVQPGYAMPSQSAVQTSLRVRQFATTDAPLRSRERPPATLDDPMLTTFAGQALLQPGDVRLSVYRNQPSPDLMDKLTGALGKLTGKIAPKSFPPDSNGLVTAEVHAKPQLIKTRGGQAADFLDPLDREQLDVSGRTVLLADAWNASGAGEDRNGRPVTIAYGARSVRNQIRALAPAGLIGSQASRDVEKVTDWLSVIPLFNGRGDLQIGKAAPDVVPADKLVRYGKAH